MNEVIGMLGLTILQNASFTLVSRARNSSSLLYHGLASVLSNGIWLLVIRNIDMKREEVYQMVDGERDYQDSRWNSATTSTEGKHSVTEWLVYIRDYTEEALHTVSRNADPEASQMALHNIRKITSMGVACMEQHGVEKRL